MGVLRDFLGRILEVWNNMTIVRKAIFGGGVLVLVFVIAISVFLNTQDNKVPLFTGENLTQADTGLMIQRLQESGLVEGKGYKIGSDGVTLYVNPEDVARLQIDMAINNLIPNGGVGFEIFDNTGFAMTDADRQIAYQRAMMGTLQKAINSLEPVEYSNVILEMPTDSLFGEPTPGTAVVTVKTQSGRTLEPRQVKGIMALVSGGVNGIAIGDVTVVDQNTLTVLSEGLLEDEQAYYSSDRMQANLRMKWDFEKKLSDELKKMLEIAFGPGKVIVKTTADLNFDAIENVQVVYDQEKIRSYSKFIQAQEGTEVTVGPGPVDNNTEQYFVDDVTTVIPGYDTYDVQANFEIDTDTTTTISAPGKVTRLSNSVIIDGTLTQQEIDAVRSMISAAVGFDEVRGDQINVASMTFDRTQQEAIAAQMASDERRANIMSIVSTVVQYLGMAAAIALLLVTFFTLRKRLNRTTSALDEDEQMEVYLAGQSQSITVDEIIEDSSPKLKPMKEDMTEREIKQFANDSPDKVADIIKTWVLKDEG